jgi:hypothetical protein
MDFCDGLLVEVEPWPPIARGTDFAEQLRRRTGPADVRPRAARVISWGILDSL